MSSAEEDALRKIAQSDMPAIFVDIWQHQQPARFCTQWTRPRVFFEHRQALIERCPRMKSCVPLLESNRTRLVAFEPSTGRYLEWHYEDSDAEEIGDSYQQFLSAFFVDLGYAGLIDLVEEVADRFGYHHLHALNSFLATDDDESPEDARMAFVRTIQD